MTTPKKRAPKKPPRAPKKKAVDELTREEYLRASLREVRVDLESARALLKSGGKAFTAVSTLRRQERELRDELDALLEEAENEAEERGADDGLDDLSDDELVAAELEAIRDPEVPPHLLEPLAVALIDRLGVSTIERLVATRGFRVVKGDA